MGSRLGKAWIVYSEDTNTGDRELVSILSPRKSIRSVADYVEQIYVDKYASVTEKIAYKKSKQSWPYPAQIGTPTYVVTCGFGPIFTAYNCYSISINDGVLSAKYRYVKTVNENLRPKTFYDGELDINVT